MAWSKKAMVALGPLSMAGCNPQFNIAGAYFPAWLACIVAGLVSVWLLHLYLVRRDLVRHLRWPAFIHLCLFVAIACALWLLFFSA